MTADEAKTVAKICETADGECSYCAAQLLSLLQKSFPEFDWASFASDQCIVDLMVENE